MKNNRNLWAIVAITTLGAMLSGCGKSKPTTTSTPIVKNTSFEFLGVKPSVAADANNTVSIAVKITVDREAILSQEFLYGADIQYSSFYDKDFDLYSQSYALGHTPARFRIVEDELQLVTDNKLNYPSDVNHPEQVISRFKILEKNEKTLTLAGANSISTLVDTFESTRASTASRIPRDSWIRSFDFDAKDNILLQETSIQTSDGIIVEFMESIFPRERLAPGKDFAKFDMDPDSPIGARADTDVAARYRLLAGPKVFHGEATQALAEHFDISPKTDGTPGTIDWWVTRNIPDDEIEPVKEAIEGWNRYFRNFEGIGRDVVKFHGRLPENIKLGDPRFNVVNWDSRLVAGAAYETQAVDPETGKQSHSLIYMPAAWFKIGADYWKSGKYSDKISDREISLYTRPDHSPRTACLRDVRALAEGIASGRGEGMSEKDFGIALLKQTLFHEVGHALGLAHNFKGSLSYDRSKPDSMFSTSIMDYNDFEIERSAFKAVNSAEGPLLEYDRQALSAIYNQAKDVSAKDAVVPACADAEADNEAGGVDPLCVRYDLEKDPSQSVRTALTRITDATIAGDTTLSQSLAKVVASLMETQVPSVKSETEFTGLLGEISASVTGVMKFYVLSGKASLSYSLRTNVRELYAWADGVLPEGYDELAMRSRVRNTVSDAVNFFALPKAVTDALQASRDQAWEALKHSGYISGLSGDSLTKAQTAFNAAFDTAVTQFTKTPGAGLIKLRTAILTALARKKTVPFYFGDLGVGESKTSVDFETDLCNLLGDVILDRSQRSTTERVAAATSLSSYRGRLQGDLVLRKVLAQVQLDRQSAKNNREREAAEALLKALSPQASAAGHE